MLNGNSIESFDRSCGTLLSYPVEAGVGEKVVVEEANCQVFKATSAMIIW